MRSLKNGCEVSGLCRFLRRENWNSKKLGSGMSGHGTPINGKVEDREAAGVPMAED